MASEEDLPHDEMVEYGAVKWSFRVGWSGISIRRIRARDTSISTLRVVKSFCRTSGRSREDLARGCET